MLADTPPGVRRAYAAGAGVARSSSAARSRLAASSSGRNGARAGPAVSPARAQPALTAAGHAPGARVSAGVREPLGAVDAHMRAVAAELDRSR
jgi:hypothetical protein